MEAFDELRKLALDKRDEAIQTARDEYARRLGEIDQLRRSLGVEPERRAHPGQPMGDMVCDLIPQDRTFTLREILDGLRKADPGREFALPSLNACIHSLRAAGMVKRVSRGDNGQAIWAAAALEVEEGEFGSLPMSDVSAVLIREKGPMTAVELVLAMQERGYRAETRPNLLVRSLGTTLKRNRGRFRVVDGRWGLAAPPRPGG
jgi:hypothetical protein